MKTTIGDLGWRSHHHAQTPKPQISDDMMINKLPKVCWYRINSNTLIKILHILNRFNLQQIDSDIIGMVYGCKTGSAHLKPC
ncbi:hypothetical protein [Nodularia chucula]|uniref:hypothetical protein n=1 Tax=Nodularia chucula TaxID=3093667 RepID=UPI0039C62D08